MHIRIHPVGWQRPGQGKYGNRYTPTKTAEFQKTIKIYWHNEVRKMLSGPIALELIFVFEMPKSWSKKKKELMEGQPMPSRPDVDNVSKSIMDALNGIAWKDDAQIYYLKASKKWGRESSILIFAEDEQEASK